MKISMKMNPVLSKEIKINSRSTKTLVSLLIINSVLALIGLIVYWVIFTSYNYNDYIDYESLVSFYTVMAWIIFIMFLIIIPALTASAISGERERQTLEILLTTKMKTRQIIFGKTSAALCTLGMYTIVSMPILSLIFTIGGVDLLDIVKLLGMILFTGLFVGSIGIFYSTVIKKTIGAIVSTYFTELFLAGGTLAIILVVYYIMEMNNVNYTVYVGADIGPVILLALFNPIITFMNFMDTQVGGYRLIEEMFVDLSSFGNDFLYDNWTLLSIIVQALIAILMLFLASKNLNSVKKPRRNKK